MSVSVATLIPSQAVLEMPKSTSKHVLRRRQVEILPMENTEFTYAGNDSIKFNISSSTELLDGLDSYIKMDVQFTNAEAANRQFQSLDAGGAHALFRQIELRTQNGTLIQRYDNYNRWYAIMSYATHAPQHVEVVEASAGDSVGSGVGAIGAGGIVNVVNPYQPTTEYYAPRRGAVARAGAKVKLVFKPAVSFLQQKQWIPLAFIKQGLQLELKLERPEHVLEKGMIDLNNPVAAADDVNEANALNYTVSDPKFMAMMVTADESIMAEYLKEFNSGGLHMSILGYKHDRRSFDNSSANFNSNFHIGVRSARHVLSVAQASNISQATGAAAQNNQSLSTFLDFSISKYQFKSGSEEFPYRAVNCDAYSAEAFEQLMLTTNQHAGTLWNVRMSPKEWRRVNSVRVRDAADATNGDYANVATKFIMSARLDRNDDNFTGLDLSLNPLDMEITGGSLNFAAGGLNANVGSVIIHVFVAYDILVSISADGVVIRK